MKVTSHSTKQDFSPITIEIQIESMDDLYRLQAINEDYLRRYYEDIEVDILAEIKREAKQYSAKGDRDE